MVKNRPDWQHGMGWASRGGIATENCCYINTDSNGRGFVDMEGSHTLETLMNEVARDVIDPQYGISILERARSASAASGNLKTKKTYHPRKPFLLARLALVLTTHPSYSIWEFHHWILDLVARTMAVSIILSMIRYDHYVRFQDPGFAYGVALAKQLGAITLRLANAQAMPFNFKDFLQNGERLSHGSNCAVWQHAWIDRSRKYDAEWKTLRMRLTPKRNTFQQQRKSPCPIWISVRCRMHWANWKSLPPNLPTSLLLI